MSDRKYAAKDIVYALRLLKKDIRELETVGAQKHLVLVAKVDIIELVDDWIEYWGEH